MSVDRETDNIARILIAFDASPQSMAALRAAADLAAEIQAELHGLFVEDVNLLRMAELPLLSTKTVPDLMVEMECPLC